jgi:hypothetical protein
MLAAIFGRNMSCVWYIKKSQNIYGGVLKGQLQKTLNTHKHSFKYNYIAGWLDL